MSFHFFNFENVPFRKGSGLENKKFWIVRLGENVWTYRRGILTHIRISYHTSTLYTISRIGGVLDYTGAFWAVMYYIGGINTGVPHGLGGSFNFWE